MFRLHVGHLRADIWKILVSMQIIINYIYNSLFKQNFVKRMPAAYKANFRKNSCNLLVNGRYLDINNRHGFVGLLFVKLLDSKNQYT
jgi:hypothetical protein